MKGILVACALLFIMTCAIAYAQPPGWLNKPLPQSQPQPPTPAASAAGGAIEAKPRTLTKVVERVKYDTVVITKIDTVIKIDTLHPPNPIYYNYVIYYEIVDKKISLLKNFLWDFSKTAQQTQLQSSDTTLLNLGNENLRTNSYTYDNLGNKTQTYEKIIEGLDMRVNGASVNITYRTGVNLLVINGKFDKFGLMNLSSDFSRRRYFLFFIPVDFLFGSEKYTLFLRIERSEVK
jgi:hypothetical protein